MKRLITIILVVLLCTVNVLATYVLVQHTAAGSSDNTTVTTAGIDTASGSVNLLIVGVIDYQAISGVPCALSDSKMNTWTALTQRGVSGGVVGAVLYYSYNPTTDAAQTFTCAHISNFPSIYVIAVSGAAASPFDQESGAAATGFTTTIQPGSITPAEDNELLVAVCGNNDVGNAPSLDTFTTSDSVAAGGGTNIGGTMAYQIQTTATARNPTCTGANMGGLGVVVAMAAFKTTAGGATARSSGLLGMVP